MNPNILATPMLCGAPILDCIMVYCMSIFG